jgi:hypothetical protein
VNNQIFVGNYSNNSITVYNRTDNDNVSPLWTLIGSNTGIDYIEGLFVDTVNNELFVSNYSADTITVYSRTASGNTFPTRTLSGLSGPGGFKVNVGDNELIVAEYSNDSVAVYSRTASGSASPLRIISGTNTGLSGPWGALYVTGLNQSTSIPTMNEWGMIIFIVLAGLGSFYYLRRQRRAESQLPPTLSVACVTARLRTMSFALPV